MINEVLQILKISVLLIILCISLTFFFFSMINMFLAAPFVPTSRKVTKQLIEVAQLTSNDVVYDLGSGDGRLVIEAARKGVKHAVGFEINPLLVYYSRIKARLFHLENATFIHESLWRADLSKCNKLIVYLLPKTMTKLKDKIHTEMKPVSLVISHSFSIPDIEPINQIGDSVKVYEIK